MSVGRADSEDVGIALFDRVSCIDDQRRGIDHDLVVERVVIRQDHDAVGGAKRGPGRRNRGEVVSAGPLPRGKCRHVRIHIRQLRTLPLQDRHHVE